MCVSPLLQVGQESTDRKNCTSTEIFGPPPLGSHVFGRAETETEITALVCQAWDNLSGHWEREQPFPEDAALRSASSRK